MEEQYQKLEQNLVKDCLRNKLHHSIIFQGIKGIGKSKFVQNLAKKITNNKAELENNPDILLIKKELNSKGEEKRDITIDKVREINNFLNLSSSSSKYRIIIIDCIDDLNHNSANAILKNLEEPSSQVFFFLINHNQEKILDTIKSRCNIIKIDKPSYDNFCQMVKKNTINISEHELSLLFEISESSIDQALEFYKNDSFKIYQNIVNISLKKTLNDLNKNIFLSDLIKKDKNLLLTQQLVNLFLTRIIKKSKILFRNELFDGEEFLLGQYLKNNNIDNIFDKYDNINKIFYETNRLNLDKLHSLNNIFNNL